MVTIGDAKLTEKRTKDNVQSEVAAYSVDAGQYLVCQNFR